MSVGLLLITHKNLGKVMLETVKVVTEDQKKVVGIIEVDWECDPEKIFDQAKIKIQELDSGQGVLVLTDLYGATPCNISNRLFAIPNVRVVTGLNLPMLFKVFNYSDQKLEQLVEKALDGGRAGVMAITKS